MKYEKRLVLFTLFAINLIDQPAPEVKIEQGIVSGKISADGTFFEYLGIPYATSNIDTRFKAPLPPPKWDGVYKARDEMYSCPQTSVFGMVIGSEDCLKINVYVPAQTHPKPFPVMVFIHGGAFILGSGGKLLYGPDFLVQNEVIMVSFHYRLGALGFTCLGIEEAPGNAGLKDQIAALRWVQKNIAAFGGDPDNVTLFGQSAGGASTSHLLASEATVGLFHKAIIQSGSSLANWALNRKPVWVASLLAKALGHDTEDPHEIYKILSKLPYKDLIRLKPVKPLGSYFDTLLLHLPCIEKPLSGVEPVISDFPINLMKNKPKNIPLMIGSTSREGLFLLSQENETTIDDKNNRYIFASDLDFDDEKEALETSTKINEFYFGKSKISHHYIDKLEQLYTDLYFEIPAYLESDIHMEYSKGPVFNYWFNYSGKRNFLKYMDGQEDKDGASHADELFYIFKPYSWPFPLREKDGEKIKHLTRMWTNFAKYGNPTPSSDNLLPVKWEPNTKDSNQVLFIEDELKMGPRPNPRSYRLWADVYDKYRRTNLGYFTH